MVMSLSRMASVDYLVGHVAAGDGRAAGAGSPMTRYYTAQGYPPGTWLGSGLASRSARRTGAGTEVTEEQLRVLFEQATRPVRPAPSWAGRRRGTRPDRNGSNGGSPHCRTTMTARGAGGR